MGRKPKQKKPPLSYLATALHNFEASAAQYLSLLANVEEAWQGRHFAADGWGDDLVWTEVASDGVVQSRCPEDRELVYPFDVAHPVMVRHFIDTVATDPRRRARLLDRWELDHSAAHPCRSHCEAASADYWKT